MRSIRWGIIGCGDVTEIKSGPALQKADGSALVAVMRRDAAKAADYARRHGVGKWYSDAETLIADPEVDAIYVATPPAQHEPYALMACAAGKPCYVEKPMARNAAEAALMVEAFAARAIPLFVAYYRRALPRFVRAGEMIRGGVLGPIQTASYVYNDQQMARRTEPVPWRLSAEQSGGGLFLDLGSHALDLLDFFFGPLANVAGKAGNVARQYDVEDHVELTFSAPALSSGRATYHFSAGHREDRFTILGEHGRLEFSCFGTEPLILAVSGESPQLIELPTPPHVQQPLIQAIVDFLLGKAAPLQWLSTGVVGLRTQQVMDRVLEDFYDGRADGFWSRERNRR
ncbi:MAG TPA: Gfo/Idh/MocA family oxidoreductase [Tepidisphaeraceae bacterium]|nr:Gfo/Idh/MocA family oxidoreductase [Tepidisphaeraceae bacterium]